jgi:pheromone shutdown-related protein TraB
MTPGNVQRIEHEGREIFVVGTAHVSARSVEEVARVIQEVRPDTVCVELDEMRYRSLTDADYWRNLDIFTVIRQQKVLYLMVSIALSAYQRRLGERLGVKPGAELVEAVRQAEAVGAKLVLADRDIQATLKRTWRNLSLWNKLKLTAVLVAAPFEVEEITAEQIEELKDRDNLGEMMREFARVMPQVKTPLIDERDCYLMSNIQEAPGPRVVAVVGAGHVEGILSHLGEAVNRADLARIPPPSRIAKILGWAIPAFVLVAFWRGYQGDGAGGLLEMILAWILPTFTLSVVFGVLAGARPLSILAGAVSAPLTTLHPALAAGMFAGLVEAWIRKPTVADCERVGQDVTSLRGIYRNRFTRVLWVFLLVNVGAALGAWGGAAWIATLL